MGPAIYGKSVYKVVQYEFKSAGVMTFEAFDGKDGRKYVERTYTSPRSDKHEISLYTCEQYIVKKTGDENNKNHQRRVYCLGVRPNSQN